MKFSVFQISRKGGREKNEDRMGYCYTSQSGLFLLADGMGGHPQGEVAAQLALQTISAQFQKQATPVLADVQAFMESAALAAHERILRYAAAQKMGDTPRTTLVLALIQAGQLHWLHCGDSRLYLVRQAAILQRTRDHSYVEQQRNSTAPPNPARMNRNVLYTCLGSPAKPVWEVSGPVPLALGDKVLLCSDGLWDNLPDADIAQHLARKPVAQAAPELVDQALMKGGAGSDNVTVLALEWETPDAGSASAHHAPAMADDGGFTSTVQATDFDTPEEDFDDAAIERSIAEINEAIRRSAASKL